MFRLWPVWILSIWTCPFILALCIRLCKLFVCWLIDGLGLMLSTQILLLPEPISMPYPAVICLQLLSELLEFCFTASHQIDVVSKPHVAKRPSTDEHWWQWGVNFFCIFFAASTKQSLSDWSWGVTHDIINYLKITIHTYWSFLTFSPFVNNTSSSQRWSCRSSVAPCLRLLIWAICWKY